MSDLLLLVVVVFVGVFVVLALLMFAVGGGAAQRAKQTLANLESVLAAHSREVHDQMVDIRKAELLSAVPWVNRWLLSVSLAPKLRTMLLQANLSWTAGRVLLMAATFFVIPGYLVYVRTENIYFGLMIGLLCGFAPIGYVMQKRKKRFEQFEQGLPEALDLIVSALRAGHSLVAALRLVAQESPEPLGGEFRICFEEQNYGLELRTAMENLVERVPLQDLRIVATAILIQKESGGNLAEVLDKAAELIRDRFRLRRQVRVHTAQGRLTGMILSILPVVLGFLLYLVNPDTMRLLWTNPIGLKLLYGTVTMVIVGGLIIRKIVNMEV
jgi:tight adherence protein B